MDISCIILAGGKSLRLGRAKALETVGKRSLLQWVLFRLSLFSSDILIITSAEQRFAQFAGNPRLKIITDIYPGTGLLGGIYTGLAASDSLICAQCPLVGSTNHKRQYFLNPILHHKRIYKKGRSTSSLSTKRETMTKKPFR